MEKEKDLFLEKVGILAPHLPFKRTRLQAVLASRRRPMHVFYAVVEEVSEDVSHQLVTRGFYNLCCDHAKPLRPPKCRHGPRRAKFGQVTAKLRNAVPGSLGERKPGNHETRMPPSSSPLPGYRATA